MKVKKYAKILTATLLLMTILTLTVFANGSTPGTWGTYSVGGYTYGAVNSLVVTTDTTGSTAYIVVQNTPTPTLAAGHFGVQGRIFENNALRFQGSWFFNSAGGINATSNAAGPTTKGKNYYAMGLIQMWNGTAYSQTSLISTATITAFSVGIYQTNANGQTYGSAADVILDEMLPDLILVIGVNENEGYVYASELNADKPSNPTEVVAYLEKLQEMKDNGIFSIIIPVYESDGETIIDEFVIDIN